MRNYKLWETLKHGGIIIKDTFNKTRCSRTIRNFKINAKQKQLVEQHTKQSHYSKETIYSLNKMATAFFSIIGDLYVSVQLAIMRITLTIFFTWEGIIR